ncbi:MAG: bacillithiol biosynthesis cysteine-adding enzyme BshC [Gemmatimonadetes bacterium]|nr:bacillithiol biosynthesis cysteine-adding enzyme BshC [Gemmatimonadota bacterium]
MNRTTKDDMELIVSHPRGRPVVADYLDADPEAVRFYGRHFSDLNAYRSKAEDVDARFDRQTRKTAAAGLTVPPGADPARLERFVEEGGYVVTTGQQPGLYGGPLYSIYKGLTAVRVADALEAALGKPVLPVFWVASDDHDWEEANHTWLIGVDNELHRFALPAPDGNVTPPLHRIELGASADESLAAFVGHLPETDFSGPYVDAIREGFGRGGSLPGGFHRLLHGVLGRFGMYFLDAAEPTLKRATRDFLLDELGRAAEMEKVLHSTEKELENAGYGVQATIMEGGINLFMEGPAGRERLYREGAHYRLRTSGEVLSEEAIRDAVEADPTVLSPNVMLRPVVESAFLPTLSYVGGPGEIAYFAELRGYFEAHGMEMPVIHPRWSVTVVETKIRKVLDKFGLDIGHLDRPFHEVATGFAKEGTPASVQDALGALRGAIGSGTGDLQKAVTEVDPTLKGPVQTLRNQTFAALADVEKKVSQAVKRESEIALSQIEKAQLHLFPDGKPAERVQNALYYLTRYGDAFLDQLSERFEVKFDG